MRVRLQSENVTPAKRRQDWDVHKKSCHIVIMAASCRLTLFDSFGCSWSCKMCQFFWWGNELDVAVFLLTLCDANCVPGYPAGSTPGFQLCPLIIYTGSKTGALKRIHCLMELHLSKQGSISGHVVPNEHTKKPRWAEGRIDRQKDSLNSVLHTSKMLHSQEQSKD